MAAAVVSWDRALKSVHLYSKDGLEIAGYSAMTLGRLCSHC